jgi:4-alpha-glucanotransferase
MSDTPLRRLAAQVGLQTSWSDAFGVPQTVSPDTIRSLLTALGLPCDSQRAIGESEQRLYQERLAGGDGMITATLGTPIRVPTSGSYQMTLEDGTFFSGTTLQDNRGFYIEPTLARVGYHRLTLNGRETILALTPDRCFSLADVIGERKAWGSVAQIYGLGRRGDGGIGDLTALAECAELLAEAGADALATSPLHALFSAIPGRCSPYSPSSRLALNPLYADPGALFDGATVRHAIQAAGLEAERAALEAMPLIDPERAGQAKQMTLRVLYGLVLPALRNKDTTPGAAFAAFSEKAGSGIKAHAVYEALHAHFLRTDPNCTDWRHWPEAYRQPQNPQVATFVRAHRDEVDFHLFLQWLTSSNLAAAQNRAKAAGMAIGLILDLAIGTDPGGSHAWSHQGEVLVGPSIGAPPDLLNRSGQNWGLTGFSPRALKRTGFAPFIAMLRAAMRSAGGLRIDHILGFSRHWLVPEGASATEGAYLTYPMADLLRILALESHRQKTVVIGEDLGTVPPGFRADMAKAGVMGIGVLWFERNEQGFLSPDSWSTNSIAVTTTHDLPTIAGWWERRDIAVRFPRDLPQKRAELDDRTHDRDRLIDALETSGSLPATPTSTQDVVDGAIRHIAGTASPLALVPLEDLLGLTEQPNLPGTVTEYPNWRRRLAPDSEGLHATAAGARMSDLAKARPKS